MRCCCDNFIIFRFQFFVNFTYIIINLIAIKIESNGCKSILSARISVTLYVYNNQPKGYKLTHCTFVYLMDTIHASHTPSVTALSRMHKFFRPSKVISQSKVIYPPRMKLTRMSSLDEETKRMLMLCY
jgi:hypothetical protein